MSGSFHSEWRTIGKHRVYFHCRSGFPTESMVHMANVVINQVERFEQSRLVEVFSDCKNGVVDYLVATTDPTEFECLKDVLHDGCAREDGQSMASVRLVPPYIGSSDSHNHNEWLHRHAAM